MHLYLNKIRYLNKCIRKQLFDWRDFELK